MAKIHIACCGVLLFALQSCGSRYYIPAMYGHDNEYKIKPHSRDSVKSMIYGTASLVNYSGTKMLGSTNGFQFSGYHSHTFKYFNISYGLNYSAGSFNPNGLDSSIVNKRYPFNTYGGSLAVNFKYSSGRVDIRPFGLEFAYQKESGLYADFRRKYLFDESGPIRSITQTEFFSAGYNFELDIKLATQLNYGFRVGFYSPLRTTKQKFYTDYDVGSFVFTNHISYRNYAFNFGFSAGGIYSSIRAGLVYGLPTSRK